MPWNVQYWHRPDYWRWLWQERVRTQTKLAMALAAAFALGVAGFLSAGVVTASDRAAPILATQRVVTVVRKGRTQLETTSEIVTASGTAVRTVRAPGRSTTVTAPGATVTGPGATVTTTAPPSTVTHTVTGPASTVTQTVTQQETILNTVTVTATATVTVGKK